MKLMGFFYREEVYKSTKEDSYPILLEFGRNGKIVVFKDLGPNH
jgi:hypothetical protein